MTDVDKLTNPYWEIWEGPHTRLIKAGGESVILWHVKNKRSGKVYGGFETPEDAVEFLMDHLREWE